MDPTKQTRVSSPARKITRLPEHLVNQIAAGEVVERPASVVKELVENSLDAGARRIEVRLVDGGIVEVSVLDDGWGLPPEELPLSVLRYATSKICQESDLEGITTFGFRGEALASIASVSTLEIMSRELESPKGFALRAAYGEIEAAPRPVGMAPGTRVTVRDLFGRVPARRKFLRAGATEFAHAARTLREIAIGNPQTEFVLFHQGRLSARYGGSTRRLRVTESFRGKDDWTHFRETVPEASLEAFLGFPGGELFFYVNGRGVRNRGLIGAVRAACGEDNEPSGVVYLDIEPTRVDVNAHPQKLEVRCHRQESLFGWISQCVRKHVPAPPPPQYQNVTDTFRVGVHVVGKTLAGDWVLEDAHGMVFVVTSHRLSSPRVISVSPAGLLAVEKHSEFLRAQGFEVEPFSEGDVMLHTRPDGLSEKDLDRALTQTLEGLIERTTP